MTARSAGPEPLPKKGVEFTVWAPRAARVELCLDGRAAVEMRRLHGGYHRAAAPEARPGDRYFYRLDGGPPRPDPASRFQPLGVHGPSEVPDPRAFRWTDRRWKRPKLRDLVFYEIHVGAFTPRGDFDGVREKLPHLRDLGVTCLEIMPIAQFPGARNWGYDGVFPYAPQNSYGGPEAFKRLVNGCHAAGLAVCLDVVYNHLGPEGNYLRDFGPYFTDRHRTPWGEAMNYDAEGSAAVRRFAIDNARYWVREFHVDALRLDAVHAIHDSSRKPLLREMKEAVGNSAYLIAEYERRDTRLVRPPRDGGCGLDAQWADDFHHGMQVTLTGEKHGYYADFTGPADVERALEHVFASGPSAGAAPRERFVFCLQNHDQVGNRAWGDRLAASIPFETQKAAAALLLFAPALPLLFMGEEYGETAPFRYFVDHGDEGLLELVRMGRRDEFKAFGWNDVPDPAAAETFQASKLKWPSGTKAEAVLRLHRDLLSIRKTERLGGGRIGRVERDGRAFRLRRRTPRGEYVLHVSLEGDARPLPPAARLLLDTNDPRYGGPGEGRARALLGKFARGKMMQF